jgi:hypothetical protein
VEVVLRDLDRKLGVLFHALEEDNADFEGLQRLEKHAGEFTAAELDELRSLLGLYGMDTARRLGTSRRSVEAVTARQQFWAGVRVQDVSPVRRAVADRAESRYGLILGEMAHVGRGK